MQERQLCFSLSKYEDGGRHLCLSLGQTHYGQKRKSGGEAWDLRKITYIFSTLCKAGECYPFYGRLLQLAFSQEPAAVGTSAEHTHGRNPPSQV